MKCPAGCDSALVMSERQGVEIDYCPTCRGVWLDRGELDKIIERANLDASRYASAPPPPSAYDDDHRARYDDDRRQPKRKKKESFLSEIFDFG
jgi:uncharacterized protein